MQVQFLALTWPLTSICNYSPSISDTLFWPPWPPGTHGTDIHAGKIPIHIKTNKQIKALKEGQNHDIQLLHRSIRKKNI